MGLQMEFDDVIAKGENIKGHSEEVTNLQKWLTTVVNEELPTIWKGSGYEGFASKVEEMKPSFDAMRQLIEDIGNGVIKNAEEYKAFDESAASSNRGA